MTASSPTSDKQLRESDGDSRHWFEASLGSPSLQVVCTGCAFSAILRLLSSTWRVECEGSAILDELVQSKRRHILAFWHRHYIALFRLLRDRPAIAVTNNSSRGQVIANICRRSGIRTLQVQGKGTKRLLESLDGDWDDHLGLAIAVDGPLGPPCEVKRVVLHLAAKMNCPIVPISVELRRKHVFVSRWDRLEIPHCFSRVSFIIGTPFDVPPRCSRVDSRELASRLKNAIDHESL